MIQFIKKIVYGKTSIPNNMFGEKMFYVKYPFRVIRKSNESSLKA